MKSFLTLVLFMFSAAAQAGPIVNTSYGEVEGTEGSKTLVFRGIPYALAPIGKLRWQPPQPPAKFTQVFKAQKYGAICSQESLILHKSVGSEDCLSLNIWRPKNVSQKLPVLFWIHGGANTLGASNQQLLGSNFYDGAKLAEQGSIVVSINYRLGALGFMAHPSLKGVNGLLGNYGILDQIAALKYVKQNIESFGGDAENVTIFGESAGGINVMVLMASPLAKGLFAKAIVQSGFLNDVDVQAATAQSSALVTELGCDREQTAECLRSKTLEQILKATRKLSAVSLVSAGATVDGYVLKSNVLAVFESGNFARVPLIIGTNRDEMRTLLSGFMKPKLIFLESDYKKMLVQQFGEEKAAKIFDYYNPRHFLNAKLALETALTDFFAHCPAKKIVRAAARTGNPVYNYVFSHVGHSPMYWQMGAGHGLEIPFVFGHMGIERTIWERQLSREMQSYWSNFARSGNPNGSELVNWPESRSTEYLELKTTIESKSDFRKEACEFWENI